MIIRRAEGTERADVRRLAAKYDLDYEGMDKDDFWVAVEGAEVVGICGLTKHLDCLELRSLAVDDRFRKQGMGGRLVAALFQEARRDVYLTTVIPDYFARLGFETVEAAPMSMIKPLSWCEGCRRDLCRIMVKRKGR